jgi:hypothetical protein
MVDIWNSAKGVLGTVAPMLATAVGGPLAGVATKAIMGALGLAEDTSPEQVAAAVTSAGPDQLLALRKANQDFTLRMTELDIDLLRIEGDDRADARARQIAVRDRIPGVLAVLLTVGFFLVLAWMMGHGVPKDTAGSEAMLVMLGALGGAFGAVVNYYYGSSIGSARKDAAIEALSR